MAELKRCSRCCVVETQDGIRYDSKGVCNVCRQIEVKQEKIDWKARDALFRRILDDHRGKRQYDCIIPFSGGKDSTFTLWKMVHDYNIKPLVVSWDHGFYRKITLDNNIRTLKKLGVDFVKFTPSWRIIKKLMLESLKRKGDFCWHCHTGCYAYPMQIAVKFQIPLVIWGQPDAEYGSYGYTYEEIQEVNEEQFNRFINLGITAEDMLGMLDGVEKRDLDPFRYPKYEDLKRLKMVSVHLGSFVPWDTKENSRIISDELGWKGDSVEGIPPEYYYEKIECMLTGIRDYLKYIKRGFGRTTHLVSIDIRDKRMTREKGIKLIHDYDGKRPAALNHFLEIMEMTEEEFMEIAMKHMVSPYIHNPNKTKKGEPLHDQSDWDRTKIKD